MSRTEAIPGWARLLIALSLLTAGVAVLGSPGSLAKGETSAAAAPPEEETSGPRNLTLSGVVTNASSGEPVADVDVRVENRWIMEGSGDERAKGYDTFTASTGPDGRYTVDVSRGHVQLNLEHPAYQRVRASFAIENDTQLDVPMEPANRSLLTITGTVRTEGGGPLVDADVHVRPVQEDCEPGEPCPEPVVKERRAGEDGAHEREVQVDGRTVVLRYEPYDDRYASTDTDAGGLYEVRVEPGSYAVHASAEDHLEERTRVNGSEGERVQANLTLTPIPPDTVTVTGVVEDATSGEPIEHARVSVENQRWGAWNHTRTDADGRFTLRTKPGFLVIEVRAEEVYWVPCEEHREPAEAEAGGGSDASASVARSEPRPRCDGQREREHGYLPRVATRNASAGETVQVDASLERAPEPDATFTGWIVDASSQQGVPNATVTFVNEITNEWGRAQTDANGSFRIDVRHGYFTIRTHAEGYLSTARNVEIGAGETKRITLEAPPGEPRYGRCCFAVAGAEGAADRGAAEQASGAGGTGAMETGVEGLEEDRRSYEGSGGALGPYPGEKGHADPQEPGPLSTPVVGWLGTLGLVALGAAASTLFRPIERRR